MALHESKMSAKGDYIALKNEDQLSLFWGERHVWTRARPDFYHTLAGLGNNGNVVVRKGNQILFYYIDKEESALDLSGNKDIVGIHDMRFSDDGQKFCIEIEQVDREYERRVSRYFHKPAKEAPPTVHLIIMIDLYTGAQKELWNFKKEAEKGSSFAWSISGDLRYLSFAETAPPDRQSESLNTRLYLLDLKEDRVLYQQNHSAINIREISVNRNGWVVIHTEDEGIHNFSIVSPRGEKSFIHLPKASIHVVNHGVDSIALEISPDRVILLYNFEGNLVFTLDQNLLELLGFKERPVFAANDNVIVPSVEGDRMSLRRYNYSWNRSLLKMSIHADMA